MFENKMKLEFCAISQNEAFARVAVAAFASQLNPTVAEVTDIKTAVSEAVTNAIIHGYDGEEGIVRLACSIVDRQIFVEISDDGRGIENIERAMEPLYTSKPEMERSGMGFTVMETFMDYLDVISEQGKGTTVKLSKKLQ